MKISKILALGALAFAFAAQAQATTTYIYITGATAYRSTVNQLMSTLLNSPVIASNNSDLTKCDVANYHGTLKTTTGSIAAGTDIMVKVSWAGSTGGLDCVANSKASDVRGFLPDNATGLTSANTAVPTDSATDNSVAQIAFSDAYKESSGFTGMENLVEVNTTTPGVVGVVPFKWVVSGGTAASGITNITPQLAQALYSAGTLSKMAFTGNTADKNITVYAGGRDADSGTRVTALSETGYGSGNSVIQYVVTGTDGNMWSSGTYGGIAVAPSLTLNGNTYDPGNTGFSSGGNLSKSLRVLPNDKVMIAYLSKGDAGTATGATVTAPEVAACRALTYNGVAYSADSDVQNGYYSFWSYEHMYYRSGVSQTVIDFANALGQMLEVTSQSNAILVGTMNCSRSSDGGVVTPK